MATTRSSKPPMSSAPRMSLPPKATPPMSAAPKLTSPMSTPPKPAPIAGFGPSNVPLGVVSSIPPKAKSSSFLGSVGSAISNLFPSGSSNVEGVGNSITYGTSDYSTPPPQTVNYNGGVGTVKSTYSTPTGSAAGATLQGKAELDRTSAARTRIENQDRLTSNINDVTSQRALVLEKQKKADAEKAAAQAAGVFNEEDPSTSKDDEYIRSLDSQLSALQGELASSQAPNEEELNYEKQLRDLMASKEMGLQNVAEQPIPLGFITGQQYSIEKRAEAKTRPLQSVLASLQAKRAAAADSVKGRLSAVGGQLDRANSLRKDKQEYQRELAKEQRQVNREATKPFQLSEGEAQYSYNSKTGKYEKVASVGKTFAPQQPQKRSTSTRSDADGYDYLIDSQTGERIKNLGRTPRPD